MDLIKIDGCGCRSTAFLCVNLSESDVNTQDSTKMPLRPASLSRHLPDLSITSLSYPKLLCLQISSAWGGNTRQYCTKLSAPRERALGTDTTGVRARVGNKATWQVTLQQNLNDGLCHDAKKQMMSQHVSAVETLVFVHPLLTNASAQSDLDCSKVIQLILAFGKSSHHDSIN